MESPTFLRLELQDLLQRLVQLVHAMGDRHRPAAEQPASPAGQLPPPANLRPAYLRLLQQAVNVAQRLGIDQVAAPAYVTQLLVAQLRATRQGQPHPSPLLVEAVAA